MEKAQRREEEKAQQKRKEVKKEPQSKQLSTLQLKMSEEQILSTLAPLKAITVYAAAKALGVKASVAAVTLRSLYQKGLLRKEGGFSGHPIYALNQRT
jgi:small subunit ribosomal protein S25e